jgi:hypothetical protein
MAGREVVGFITSAVIAAAIIFGIYNWLIPALSWFLLGAV